MDTSLIDHSDSEEGDFATVKRELEARVEERTRQLKAANEELESFCYSVSHDMRAPLRTIASFSKIVMLDEGDKLSQEGIRNLQRVETAAKALATLVENLLEYARVSQREIIWTDIDLSALISDVASEIVDECVAPQSVVFRVEKDMHTRGDEGQLKLVLRNLLENASKYSQPNAEVDVGHVDHRGIKAFFVKDNGVGFDMQYYEKLFAPFERLHRAEEYEGTGVGLANVKKIIERHRGSVWAESVLSQGSTFYFTLGNPEGICTQTG